MRETEGSTADFIRGLRHELRTPINHIIGYSELLLDEVAAGGPSRLAPDLDKIHAAGKDLLALVDESLAAAKTDAGVVDLAALSEAVRTPLNAVVGYSGMLQEDAVELGREDLVADLRRIEEAGTQMLGLVLAVLDLGRGAAAPAPSPPPAIGGHAAPPLPSAEQLIGHGSLLVVDDDEANRDMLARRLARLGYTVALAEHGRAALDRLREAPFDLILLDVMMPEMNGYELLDRLKADETLRDIPVIVLSALDETASAVRCIELGAEDYLPKPFDAVLLRARIGACLEKKRLRDRERLYLQQIEAEKRRSDELLHVILPSEVVAELKATNAVQPRRFDDVAVLFCDIVGFTAYCDQREPSEVIPHLQQLVEAYEELALRHGLQKMKTIGDCFMAASGLLSPVPNPVLDAVRCGVDMIAAAQALPVGWTVRVGVHVGPVVAGVLGRRQYLYDVFGDTVNTAARVEQHGTPGSITLSEAAWQKISACCRGESLGAIEVRGKGRLPMYRFEAFVSAP